MAKYVLLLPLLLYLVQLPSLIKFRQFKLAASGAFVVFACGWFFVYATWLQSSGLIANVITACVFAAMVAWLLFSWTKR